MDARLTYICTEAPELEGRIHDLLDAYEAKVQKEQYEDQLANLFQASKDNLSSDEISKLYADTLSGKRETPADRTKAAEAAAEKV